MASPSDLTAVVRRSVGTRSPVDESIVTVRDANSLPPSIASPEWAPTAVEATMAKTATTPVRETRTEERRTRPRYWWQRA